jgi:hypothetical protein
MAFRSPKQRAFYFAKKSGKPATTPGLSQNAVASPNQAPSNAGAPVPQFKIPGLPKANKFGRIKRNFKF